MSDEQEPNRFDAWLELNKQSLYEDFATIHQEDEFLLWARECFDEEEDDNLRQQKGLYSIYNILYV